VTAADTRRPARATTRTSTPNPSAAMETVVSTLARKAVGASSAAGVVMLVRYATGWGDHSPRLERRSPGLDALEERYARGEIKRDEYLEKKRDITG
jgi:hypothetical protein